MSDITYFDYMCFKLEIEKKYLRYLSPYHLKVILLLCTPRATYKSVGQYLTKESQTSRVYNPSLIRRKIRDIRIRLIQLKHHANLFKVEHLIPEVSYDELRNIVNDHYEEVIIT